MRLTRSQEKVYEIVKQIPKGKVATYGQIARLSGINSPRAIGNILHINPFAPTVPCHRVVNRQGRLAINFGAEGGIEEHAKRLRSEGVTVIDNRVDLTRFGWETSI